MKPRNIQPPNSPLSDAKNFFFIISDAFRCVYFLRGDDLQVLSTPFWSQLLPKAYPTHCETSFLNSLVQLFYRIFLVEINIGKSLFSIHSLQHRRRSSINRHSVVFLLIFILNRIFLKKISQCFDISLLCKSAKNPLFVVLLSSTLQHLLAF